MYSNALNTRRFLKQLIKQVDNTFIKIKNKNYTGEKILFNLEKELINDIYIPIMNKKKIKNKFYINDSKLPEGNIYGIVFNCLGVVVNDFLNSNDNNSIKYGLNNICENITLNNINSSAKEIITLSSIENVEDKSILCSINKTGIHRGLVGDNIPYLLISDKDFYYKPNYIYNAIALIAKYNNSCECAYNTKTLYIPNYIIKRWFGLGESLIQIKKNNPLYFINLRDQMNHIMKGNIMFFISGNKNTKLNNLKIKNVSNSGKECDCDPSRIDDYKVMSESNFGNNYNLTFKNYLGNNINYFNYKFT